MSVVTYFVETSQGYLNTAAETQFGSVAATVGTLLVLGITTHTQNKLTIRDMR